MKVLHTQIQPSEIHTYTLWDGEVLATVFQHCGAYGFRSAAIVVNRMDSPLETFVWDGYKVLSEKGIYPVQKPTEQDMRQWIADRLTELSTGTDFNLGGIGDIQGLLEV